MIAFASDYLAEIPGPDDWVCVEDLCCGYCPTINRGYDVSAWWSPSRRLVAFGNNWHDVPDMPADSEPTEADVWDWVHEHPGYLQKWLNAHAARKKEREEASAAIYRFYDTNGGGEVRAEFRAPDGSVRVVEHGCGIHGPMSMLRQATSWMVYQMPAGTVLTKLEVRRKIPHHRGEKPLTTKTDATSKSPKKLGPRPRRKVRA